LNPVIAIAGIFGLLAGAGIYWGATALAQHIPTLLQGGMGVAIAFVILLLISLAEMPMMLFGLRQMARSQTSPRGLVIGTFIVFVMFAAIYASVFVLITGEFAWGLVLVTLCVVRYAGGAVLK
jgi:hypothetical protein